MSAKPYRPTPEPPISSPAGMSISQLFVTTFRDELQTALKEGRIPGVKLHYGTAKPESESQPMNDEVTR